MTAINTPKARRAAFAAQQKQWSATAAERFELARTRWDKWVLAAIILERFLTRFFTEKLAIFPGWMNFLDYPILVLFAGYILMTGRYRQHLRQRSGFGVLILALVANIVISALLNLERLHPGAFFLFMVGFLEPLAFMLLAYAMAPRKDAINLLLRVLFFVGWLQIFVVLLMDLPLFLETRNPDLVSGTFGENAYQLVFFLLAWNALILSSQPSKRTRFFWWIGVFILQALILAIILLAQFRAIIPFAVVTWGISYYLANHNWLKSIVSALMGIVIFILGFLSVNKLFPELKYQELITLGQRTDEIEGSGKVQSLLSFRKLISEQPHIMFFGTGPGTYASRGFRTFSIAGKDDFANLLYRDIFHSDYYITDVAAKYVLPNVGQFAFGSTTTATPWFSFLAVPAELGIPGLLIILGLYLFAIHKCWLIAQKEDLGNVSLARWVIVAMILLLQMAFLENWLENSRLTVPVWTIFGCILASQNTSEAQSNISGN